MTAPETKSVFKQVFLISFCHRWSRCHFTTCSSTTKTQSTANALGQSTSNRAQFPAFWVSNMSERNPAAEMNKSVRKITIVGACFTLVLVVSQCILFYRLMRLEDKMSTMQATCDELSKAQPMQLRIRRFFDSKHNRTLSKNNSGEYSTGTQSNQSSSSACEFCKSICSSRGSIQV